MSIACCAFTNTWWSYCSTLLVLLFLGYLMLCLLSQQLCNQQKGAPHCQQSTSVLVCAGGELQRFAIAVVAAQAADIYMIDEPSSYLDVRQRLKAAQVRLSQDPSTSLASVSVYTPLQQQGPKHIY